MFKEISLFWEIPAKCIFHVGGSLMYLIRRVYKVKPGTTRRAAELITQKLYEEAEQRSPIRVYMNGGTAPGPANTVYMDWIDETLRSPYREGNQIPDGIAALGAQLNELQEENYVEFYEIFSPR